MGALLLLLGAAATAFMLLRNRKASAPTPPTGMPVKASTVVLSDSPAQHAAQILKGVLQSFGPSSAEASASGKGFAAVYGIRLPPGGFGYVEAVRQAAAMALGDDPRTWPDPPSDVVT